MNSEKAQLIQHHAEAIAALLYEDISPEQVKTLESIEITVREKVLDRVSPAIALFYSHRSGGNQGRRRTLKSSVRDLSLSEQTQKLGVEARTQVSPHLQQCCLILSANESYVHAAVDLEILTGMRISKSAQQRLVHRVSFSALMVEGTVEEMSSDGRKVRLRTPVGKIIDWKDYK